MPTTANIEISLDHYLKLRDIAIESKAYLEDNHVSSFDDPHLSTRQMNLQIKIMDILKETVASSVT
jgi:hypothetical protein